MSAKPAHIALAGRCGCPSCAVASAVTLLRTGRPGMALPILEPVPLLIRDALAAEREAGREEGRALAGRLAAGRDAARVAAPAAPRPKPRERLAVALAAGRVTAGEVARILRIAPGDVQAIAEGRVGLPGSTWRRLLREIGEGRAT